MVVIIIVGAVAALVGCIVGYFWGRSDENDNAAVAEQCMDADLYDSSEKFCTYRGKFGDNTAVISIPKVIMKKFDLTTCPAKVHVCWKTEKGAPSPGITQIKAL